MTFLEAIRQVLSDVQKPLSAKAITEIITKRGLVKTSGKTPQATVAGVLYRDIQQNPYTPFKKFGRGLFGLKSWELLQQPSHPDTVSTNELSEERPCFIFIVNDLRKGKEFLPARQVYDTLMKDRLWGINERTPNRRSLVKGSQIVFYQAGKGGQRFLGTATIEKDVYRLSDDERGQRMLKSVLFDGEYAVRLMDVQVWEKPKPIKELIPKLEFIKKKNSPWMYLQGGVRRISSKDYRVIQTHQSVGEVEPEKVTREAYTHEFVEGILLELGNLLSYQTYTPDHSKTYNGVPLKNIATQKSIPQFTLDRILKTVSKIDVIWFEDDFPICCFEVEHSTDVTKGLLRLHQLIQFQCQFFIIGPEELRTKFEAEISKTPFYQDVDRYKFRSYEELMSFYRLAKRYFDKKGDFFG